jgi:predicted ATPase
LLLYSIIYGFWVANLFSFNGDVLRELATQFLALAEKQGATVPLMIAHRLVGPSLLFSGEFAESRAHLDRAFALYDPTEQLTTRFGSEPGVSILAWRSWPVWVLGYPDASLRDAEGAIRSAREIGQAPTLMLALACAGLIYILCGDYAATGSILDELLALADEKRAAWWKSAGTLARGVVFGETGNASVAVQTITSGFAAQRSTGAKFMIARYLSSLARAYANLGRFEDAWRCIDDAMAAIEATKDKLWDAEVQRVAGDIALKSGEPDAAKAETFFERALAVSRRQKAKSWELRASMSLARLWRDQGKVQQARELLAPVYGWFTEGFDTRDLKEAKALLEELAP